MNEELLKIKDEYQRALKLVSYLFKNKTDKEGSPYINHLTRVANNLDTPNTKIAGLLHDTLEDIPSMTEEKLRELNFNDEIIEIVKLVTRKNTTYHQFISDIIASNNIDAIKVKYADMCDNANPERLQKLNIITRTRLKKKYGKELPRLKKAIEERRNKND